VRGPFIWPALAVFGADQLGDLGLHDLSGDRADRIADHVSVLVTQHPAHDRLDRHAVHTGHRCSPFVEA
jgi:hypothetical protein